MSELSPAVKTVAMLQNVALCMTALKEAMNRAPNLPGLVVFNGPSGFGKSMAATYCANRTKAYYVQMQSTWTKKALLLAILTEMGIQPAKTLYEMARQIQEQLAVSQRPLLVDEADHVIDKGAIEVLRDLYEASGAVVMLIGEESLPAKLKKYERVHGRVLVWAPANKPSLEDAAQLRPLYAPNIRVSDDLLQQIHADSKASVRRIAVNLDKAQREAMKRGLSELDLATWNGFGLRFDSGDAPARRL